MSFFQYFLACRVLLCIVSIYKDPGYKLMSEIVIFRVRYCNLSRGENQIVQYRLSSSKYSIRLLHDNYRDGMIAVQSPWAKAVSGNYKKEKQKCTCGKIIDAIMTDAPSSQCSTSIISKSHM